MDNNPTAPEVVDRWRAQFEQVFRILHPTANFGLDRNGNYKTNRAHEGWFIFQAAMRLREAQGCAVARE